MLKHVLVNMALIVLQGLLHLTRQSKRSRVCIDRTLECLLSVTARCSSIIFQYFLTVSREKV